MEDRRGGGALTPLGVFLAATIALRPPHGLAKRGEAVIDPAGQIRQVILFNRTMGNLRNSVTRIIEQIRGAGRIQQCLSRVSKTLDFPFARGQALAADKDIQVGIFADYRENLPIQGVIGVGRSGRIQRVVRRAQDGVRPGPLPYRRPRLRSIGSRAVSLGALLFAPACRR